MQRRALIFIFLFLKLFLIFSQAQGYHRKFLKIENCTSNPKFVEFMRNCELADNKFNYIINKTAGTKKLMVRKKFK